MNRGKKRIIVMIIFIAAAVMAVAPLAADAVGISKLDLPPVQEISLQNGARVFYIRDELPVLTIVASFGSGRLYETSGTAGMSELIARTLTLSGSKGYPGIRLHEKVDSMGGTLNILSSNEGTVISLQVLQRFRDDAFAIVADLIAHPNFDEKHFQTARSLYLDEIKRRYDRPAYIAFDKALAMIFDGDGFGAVPTEEKVSSYTLAAVKDTWDRSFRAKNLLVGISTSIPFKDIRESCLSNFSGFEPGSRISYSVDGAVLLRKIKDASTKIYFYPKDIPQSTIVMGTVAPGIHDGGSYALTLMDFILGGGSFNSRLMREIRDKRGLAYSTYSDIRLMKGTGVFFAFAQTSNETADTVIGLMKENITLMATDQIQAKELAWAKKAFTNSFIFRFATPADVLGNYIYREYNMLPESYFQEYIPKINAVSGGDVLRESGRLLESGLVTCVVGKEDLKERLRKFGQVVILK